MKQPTINLELNDLKNIVFLIQETRGTIKPEHMVVFGDLYNRIITYFGDLQKFQEWSENQPKVEEVENDDL